jgi:hypothetical protein
MFFPLNQKGKTLFSVILIEVHESYVTERFLKLSTSKLANKVNNNEK